MRGDRRRHEDRVLKDSVCFAGTGGVGYGVSEGDINESEDPPQMCISATLVALVWTSFHKEDSQPSPQNTWSAHMWYQSSSPMRRIHSSLRTDHWLSQSQEPSCGCLYMGSFWELATRPR